MQEAKMPNPHASSVNADAHKVKDEPMRYEGMTPPPLPSGMKESATPNYPSQNLNAPKGDNGGSVDTSPLQTLPKIV